MQVSPHAIYTAFQLVQVDEVDREVQLVQKLARVKALHLVIVVMIRCCCLGVMVLALVLVFRFYRGSDKQPRVVNKRKQCKKSGGSIWYRVCTFVRKRRK